MNNRINLRRSSWRVLNELTVIVILFLLAHASSRSPGVAGNSLGPIASTDTNVQEIDSSSTTPAPTSKPIKVWGANEHLPINGPITSGHSSAAGTSKVSTPASHPVAASSPSVVSTKIVINQNGQAVPQEFVLPNGLRVVILEEHSFPMVSCMMWYRAGSRNEVPGVTGVSHLVEHLLFQNIGIFKKNELAAMIVANGGQFNGFTSEDFTAFYTNLPSTKYELAVRGESERMRGAKFTKAEVQTEVNGLAREFDQDYKDPLSVLNREVHATAFGQHPYGTPPSGWQSDVEKLTYEDARTFYDRFYHPDNATIVLAGDLKTATALAIVKKHFGVIAKSAGTIAAVRATPRNVNMERRVVLKANTKKESVLVAYRAPALSDPDAPAMMVLERLLNAQLSGRLRKQLVEPKICSAAQAVFEMKRDPSLFLLTLTALPGTTLPKVLEGGDALVSQLHSQICSDSDLARAKRQAEFDFFSEADGPYRAGFHLGFFDSLQSWTMAYAWPDKLRAVNAADLQRVANRYLNNDGRVVGFLASNAPATPPVPKASPQTTGSIKVPESLTKLYTSLSNGQDQNGIRAHIVTAGYKVRDIAVGPELIAQATSTAGTKTTTVTPIAPEHPATKPAAVVGSTEGNVRDIFKKTLSNGADLIVIESHLSPLVEIYGTTKAGSAFETPDRKGVSALLTAILNSGSAKASKQQAISEQDDLGMPPRAMVRFDSSVDNISFQSRFLSKDLNTQLSRIASSIKDPRFNDADLDKAKQEVVNAISQAEDSTKAKVQRALMRNLASSTSHFCPTDPVERAKSVNNLKTADVKDFYTKFVLPNTTTIVIAGDVTPAGVTNLLEKNLEGWTSKKETQKTPSLAAESELNAKRSSKSSIPLQDKSESLVCLGRIVPISSKESEDKLWSHLLIADCALTNHPFFSRLSQRMDSEPDLAAALGDSLRSHIQAYPDASIWSLVIPVENNSSSSVVTAIQTELKKFSKAGLTQEELIEAKRYLLGSIPVSQMSNLDGLCRTTLESFEQRDELSPLIKTSASIRGATLDSVNKFVANNFKPDQAAVVVAGSRQFMSQVHPSHAEAPLQK